jgi:two-component system chemotaxis response regulator CheB
MAVPARSVTKPINVMVVDDSAVVRGLVSREIDAEPDLCVVASASNGEMAVMELRRRAVDVIVLDIEMPVMDGMTALPLLLAEQPGVKVLIASTLTRRNGEISLKALQLGAADYLSKPEAGTTLVTAEDFKRDLVAKVRALGSACSGRATASPTPASPVTLARPAAVAVRPEVIVIGGSTGAPPVLVRLFEELRGAVRQPILLTQHMPPTFTALLAEQLERSGGRPCAEGRDGEPVVPGRAYVAPGGWHMTVAAQAGLRVIRLDQEPPENFCRPAVDPLFRSIAKAYGSRVLAVVLTGMGSDGAKGCEAISQAGGRFVVQDEASSAVWGMPGAAARTGLADRIVPLAQLASFIAQAAETGV